MHKLTALLVLFVMTACTTTPSETTLHVRDGHLYTAAGEKFVMRGFNEMFVWSEDPSGERLIPQIDQSGANAVRLVWDHNFNTADLETLIDLTVEHKMVAIPECHNATGKWDDALQACIDFWNNPHLIEKVESHKQWTIVNIANEAGGHSITDEQFIEAYSDAIASLRRWGYTVPIMIDAAVWGQDVDQLLRVGPELSKQDPLENVIFSTHSYWSAEVAVENYKKVAITAKEKGLAMIVGEGPSVTRVGQCDDPEPLPYLEGMELLHIHEAGWLNWSWGGLKNGDCDDFRYFDITDGGQFGQWLHRPGANIVALSPYSVMRTSERPVSFYDDGRVAVSGAYLHIHEREIPLGEHTNFEVIIAPANAHNTNYTLSITEGTDIVRADRETGTLYGLSPGSAEITVITEDGQMRWSVPVTVLEE
ncbi:cellulase family glycosylhydrolase [Marinimicrobium sp. ABcell2]|uniref:cellulase family glycosylhydrolase n=1 Tax=Marinimicrobium sp. ABcell2 TaxID=3069751 RepID=UPI0027B42BA0|nr:cellulase family glycosylhydrolase [Marinimicrobium sp. ABcell2]MDQ2077047.1 cellulase family glycosylhydrolase [Marinimicrobium sp. ABcell2]